MIGRFPCIILLSFWGTSIHIDLYYTSMYTHTKVYFLQKKKCVVSQVVGHSLLLIEIPKFKLPIYMLMICANVFKNLEQVGLNICKEN